MKITSKGRYAVLAMVDIARHSKVYPCNLTNVSIRQNISLTYLERIFNDLKKANLVESKKFVALSWVNSTFNLFM